MEINLEENAGEQGEYKTDVHLKEHTLSLQTQMPI